MLLRRVSLITDAKQKSKDSLHPEARGPARAEIEERVSGADVTEGDNWEEEINLASAVRRKRHAPDSQPQKSGPVG